MKSIVNCSNAGTCYRDRSQPWGLLMWKDKSVLIKRVLVAIFTDAFNFSYPVRSTEFECGAYFLLPHSDQKVQDHPKSPSLFSQPALLHSKEL